MSEIEKVITALLYHVDLGKISVTGHGEYDPKTKYEEASMIRKGGRTYMTLVPVQGIDPSTDSDMKNYMLICEKGEDWFEAYVKVNHYEGTKEEFFLLVQSKIDLLDTRAKEAQEAADKAHLEARNAITAANEANRQVQIAIQTINSTNAVKDNAINIIRLTKEAKDACVEATTRAIEAKNATEEVARATTELNVLMTQAKDDTITATNNAKTALQDLQTLVDQLEEAERLRVESQDQRVLYDNQRKTFYDQAELDEKTRKEFFTQTKLDVGEWGKAEASRVTAEEKRVTEFSSLKQNSEAATNAANTAANHAEESATTIDSKINPVIASDKAQNGRLDKLEGDVSDLQKFYGADFCVGTYDEGQLAPEALETKGSRAFALDWYPWLVDMTDNAGHAVTRAWTLKKNNWFRYGSDGKFAPAVCVTQEDYDLCNAELYLDAAHTQKYCEALAFDAEAFFNEYGMTQKLYSVDGVEIAHIRRPWETTNKDLGTGVGRKNTIRLCDMMQGRSGKLIKGVFGSQTNYDGAQFAQFILPPTILSPTPICTVGNKSRFFFYLMKGETNCDNSKGPGNCSDLFTLEKKTYPRVNDMHQVNDMKWSRANNADPNSPVPFAEGGFFAYNAFLTSMEVGYGTRLLHSATMFSSGISSNDSCSGEESWKSHGGVRYRKQGDVSWQYGTWGSTSNMCYDTKGGKKSLSEFLNTYEPKSAVNEGQIALSYAAELGIQPNAEFQLYGETYWYQNVDGAVPLLDGEMNARLYKKMTGVVNAYNADGTPQAFEVEMILRMGIVQGMNISGDVFAYWGGGYEQVGDCTVDPNVSRSGNPIRLYIEPNQEKWVNVTDYKKAIGEDFIFENLYIFLGMVLNPSDGGILNRVPYAGYPRAKGGGTTSGDCAYGWMNNYWGSLGFRFRIAARFRGHANYSFCAPRNLTAINNVLHTNRFYAGSAQVLNRAPECNALQAQHEAQRSATMALQKPKKKEQQKTDVSPSPSDEVKNPA